MTGCLNWLPMLRQMRESMLRHTLHVLVASETQKIGLLNILHYSYAPLSDHCIKQWCCLFQCCLVLGCGSWCCTWVRRCRSLRRASAYCSWGRPCPTSPCWTRRIVAGSNSSEALCQPLAVRPSASHLPTLSGGHTRDSCINNVL